MLHYDVVDYTGFDRLMIVCSTADRKESNKKEITMQLVTPTST